MWIVAVAWVYVVGLMAVTETSIVAGIMTFLGYCVLPLSILFYLTGGKRRAAKRAAAARSNAGASHPDSTPSHGARNRNDDPDSGSDADSGGGADGGGD